MQKLYLVGLLKKLFGEPNRMNDKEKVEAVKKLLSLNISSFEDYARYVGIIHNILDEKMTMTEVDEYIKDNF